MARRLSISASMTSGEDGQRRAHAPVDGPEHDQHADQQQQAAQRPGSTNCEKKFASAVTSPSMRSISSPGVRALWKARSSRRQCSVRSARRALVAVQATRSPT